MALESKIFFEVVKKHGLVSEKQFLNLQKAVKKDALSQTDLDTLVSKNYLTKWQVTRLVAGKHNFSVGEYTLLDYVGKDAFGEVYLVRSKKAAKGIKRLRLVAKAISDNADEIKNYLSRVQAFQSIGHPRLTRVSQVAEVGSRHIVVTDRPAGKSVAAGMKEEPQTEEAVCQMINQLAEVVGDLEMADLHHSSLDSSTVCLSEKNGWSLDLPAEIGFAERPNEQDAGQPSSNVNALAMVAASLLGTDSSSGTVNGVASGLAKVLSNPQSSLDDLKSAVAGDTEVQTPEVAESDIDTLGTVEAVEVTSPIVSPSAAEPQVDSPQVDSPQVGSPQIDSIEGISPAPVVVPAESVSINLGENTPAPAAEALPAVVESATNETSTNESATNESATNEAASAEVGAVEPAVVETAAIETVKAEPEVVTPVTTEPVATETVATQPATAQPAATEPVAAESAIVEPEPVVVETLTPDVGTVEPKPATPTEVTGDDGSPALAELESIDKQDEMFGDFDQVEVVSEIQTPQPMVGAMPVVVDGGATSVTARLNEKTKKKPKEEKEQEDSPAASNKKVLIFAAAGGGVGVVVLGLLIFFLTRGNDKPSDQKLASNDNTNASFKEKKNDDSSKGNSDAEKGKTPDDAEDKAGGKGPKSSGTFKGIGAFNKQDPNAGLVAADKNDLANKNPTTDEKQTPKKGDNKQAKTGNKQPKATPDKAGKSTGDNQGKTAGGIPGLNPNPGVNKGNTGGNPGNTQPKKNQPEKSPSAKKNEPKGKKGKEANDGDETVLLIGQPKKKDDAKKSGGDNASKLANPFTTSPDFVSLKPAKRGAQDNTAFQKLIPLKLPPGLPLNVTLHGGDRASKVKLEFNLKASTSKNATWNVTAKANKQQKPIGQFHFDGKDFGFSWDPAAEGFSNSMYLMNCAVRIQASEYKHVLALRPPTTSATLDFSKNFSPKADAKLEDLPNMASVKIVLIDIPKGFPKFEYPKGKDFLIDRSDSLNLAFKINNIDVLRGVFSSRLRGNKLLVGVDMIFVTPDKQFQPMASLEKFEKAVEQLTAEYNQLDARVKQLDTEYNKLQDPAQKGKFTQLTGRTKLKDQLKVTKTYKDHMQNALEISKAIGGSKLKFRVFYQAGEIELDLATPDGKKYTPPRPAPAQAAKGKTKKK